MKYSYENEIERIREKISKSPIDLCRIDYEKLGNLLVRKDSKEKWISNRNFNVLLTS
jgi:hypothetical protein